jgi:hypothetical protein
MAQEVIGSDEGHLLMNNLLWYWLNDDRKTAKFRRRAAVELADRLNDGQPLPDNFDDAFLGGAVVGAFV